MYSSFRSWFIYRYPRVHFTVFLISLIVFFVCGGPFFVNNLPLLFAIFSAAMQGYLLAYIATNLLPALFWVTMPKKKEDEDEM